MAGSPGGVAAQEGPMGTAVLVGLAIGVGLGLAVGNLVVGLGIGLALGVGVGSALRRRDDVASGARAGAPRGRPASPPVPSGRPGTAVSRASVRVRAPEAHEFRAVRSAERRDRDRARRAARRG